MTDAYLSRAIEDLAEMFTPEVVMAECHRLLGPVTPSANSRASDPATSKAAGDRRRVQDLTRFSAFSRPGRLLATFAECGWGLTAYQAALLVTGPDLPVTQFEGCRRRVSDLARIGYIEDSGETRANQGTDDESVVWKISTAGRLALDALAETGWTKPGARRTKVAA